MDMMGLKKKILDEILEDLDGHEGEKIRPKAAVSITAMRPEGLDDKDDDLPDELDHPMLGGGLKDDDDDNDDDMKMLLEHYLSQK